MKRILATKELSVNIGGVTYEVLLIPREKMVDIDYSQCPEDSPLYKRDQEANEQQ